MFQKFYIVRNQNKTIMDKKQSIVIILMAILVISGCKNGIITIKVNPPKNNNITKEICNGIDDDKDGLIDEGLIKNCTTYGIGLCKFGTRECINGSWSKCKKGKPREEICGNKQDEDCNGKADDGCLCLYMFYNNKDSASLKELEFLLDMQSKYHDLIAKTFTINTSENIDLMYKIANKYGIKIKHTPVTFIGNKAIIGFNKEIAKQIEKKIKYCKDCKCPKP